MANLPLNPKHPERICWGCEKLCPADDLRCREERALHPCEAYGGGKPDPVDPQASVDRHHWPDAN